MNAATESCSNCRFWFKDRAGTYCRRFPPVTSFVPPMVGVPGGEFVGWARTSGDQWCGEWRADLPGGGIMQAIPLVRTNQSEEYVTPIHPPDPPPQGEPA